MALAGTHIAGNWRYWDNRQNVVYYSADSDGDKPYSLEADGGAVRKKAIRTGEVIASAGVYTKSDRIWLVPVQVLPAALSVNGLKPADRVREDDDTDWTVLEAELITWDTIWKLTTRNLVLANDLRDLVTIQRPTIAVSGAGVTTRTWPPSGGTVPYAALACKIQAISGEVSQERSLRGFVVTHEIYLAQQVTFTADDRIKDLATGTLYEVRGYHKPDRIDELPVVDAEIVP